MIDFDKHYPKDIFTPLSKLEKEIILKALNNCRVNYASMRLYADWARQLADVARYDDTKRSESESEKQ